MTNILITSAGQRVSLVRAFKKELTAVDKSGKVYTVDLNPTLAPACHVSDGYKSVPRATDPSYISSLLSICLEFKIKMLVPTIDTELLILSQNRDTFIKNGIIPIISSPDFIQKCRDKREINKFFEKNRIPIPKSIEKKSPSFPLFIKPYDGSLSKDTFLINNASELTDYHLSNEKLMFMEYIDRSQYDEYTVDAYYDIKNMLKCLVPRKRIFVRAGEVNKSVTHKNELMNFLSSRLQHIEGAIGCLTMQFFFNPQNKSVIGIEINPRFGGGYPLSYLAGANYPSYLIREYILNESIDYTDQWEQNLLMLRYDDEILIKNYNQ